MTNKLTIQDQVTEFLLYSASNSQVKVEVLLNNENLWLTQKRMAELFSVGVPAISKHLKNIFDSNELMQDSVISILETTADDGKKYQTKYYNLDAVISVGYRVNSSQATQFRIWATSQLKELIIKGFVIDDERLKNGQHFGKDYFKELLEGYGNISREAAKQKAFDEYDKFNKQQKIDSDFDYAVKKLKI
ncbi:MAG: virulence RhuM family protein [Colwellia sp.]|nr:virulence RhuM family protein [Colwellia sp.]